MRERQRRPELSGVQSAEVAAEVPATAPGLLLQLQSLAGNQAVHRLIVQRDGLDAGAPADAGLRDVPVVAGAPRPSPAPATAPPPAPEPPATVPAPAQPTTGRDPAPAQSAAPTVQPQTGAVQEVPGPVMITPVPDGPGRVSELAASTERFSGVAEVAAFAEALATEYGRRVAIVDAVERLRTAAATRTRETLRAEPPREDETERQRRDRINDEVRAARAAVARPARGDEEAEAQLRDAYRQEQLDALEVNWRQHVTARSAQGRPAHWLANMWMVNRNQELLFRLMPQPRVQGAMRMWTHYRIMTPEQEAATPDGVTPPTVNPTAMTSGRGPRPESANYQAVTVRAAEFLTELEGNFQGEHWDTRPRHGSGGFGDRGLSVDMYLDAPEIPLPGLRHDRFWDRDRVVALFHALEATASTTHFHFYALYNDFSAARAANAFLTRGSVDFTGNVDPRGGLNYHGGGEKLHVHLDLVPDELMVLTRQGERVQASQPAPAPRVAPQ